MVAANKVKDLGDRYTLQQDENQNTYEAKIVESALDFDKAEYEEKEEFYDRTMAAIQKLVEKGAFEEPDCQWLPDKAGYNAGDKAGDKAGEGPPSD